MAVICGGSRGWGARDVEKQAILDAKISVSLKYECADHSKRYPKLEAQ